MIGNIDYPESILPKEDFFREIDFDLLLASNKNIYMLRRSEKSFENTFKKVGKDYYLRIDAVQNQRLPKLSINLLGTFFKKEYLKYNVPHNKPGGAKWLGHSVVFKNFFNDYSVVDVGCEIYLHANNIDGKTFPYSYPYSKDSAKIVSEFEKIVGGGALAPIKDPNDPTKSYYPVFGTIKIIHDPLILNYWHAEMITKGFNDKEVTSTKPTWTDKYFKSIMTNVISVNAYPEVVKIGTINNNVFSK